jgi:hypothetical protein
MKTFTLRTSYLLFFAKYNWNDQFEDELGHVARMGRREMHIVN